MPDGNKKLNLFFSKCIFVGSFNKTQDLPENILPEFCFIGRSNVGKSSIINAINKSKKKLARTSKTPGRTQNINLYKINNLVNLIDLPGYGYAKVSKKNRGLLAELINSYFNQRENITMIFILVDCKVGIKNIDIDFFDNIMNFEKNFSIILTKTDKCKKNYIETQINSILSLMKNYNHSFKNIFSSSVKKNKGILDLQKQIFNLSKKYEI